MFFHSGMLMKVAALLLALLVVLACASGAYAKNTSVSHASAILKNLNGTEVGTAQFSEDGSGPVHIIVHVKGLSPGEHGIHIHEAGNCTAPFKSAGDHYNPLGKHHGLNNSKGAHAGDLPNLVVNKNGEGNLDTTSDRITLTPGPTTLFTKNGTSLVIHSGPDDQVSDPSGNSGNRIACGVIKPE
jgi:superoxide dismutase, Cu-Zn family